MKLRTWKYEECLVFYFRQFGNFKDRHKTTEKSSRFNWNILIRLNLIQRMFKRKRK